MNELQFLCMYSGIRCTMFIYSNNIKFYNSPEWFVVCIQVCTYYCSLENFHPEYVVENVREKNFRGLPIPTKIF